MDFVVLFAQFTSFQEPNDLRLLRFFFFFYSDLFAGCLAREASKSVFYL